MSNFHSNWINMNGMINTIELHRNVGRRVRSIRNAHCFNNFEESYCNWRADSIYPVFRCYSKRKDADANAIINELKRCPIKVVVNKCYDSNEHYCLHWYLINQSTSLCIQLVPMLIIREYSRLNSNVHLRFRIAILWNVRFMCGLKQSYTQIKVKKKYEYSATYADSENRESLHCSYSTALALAPECKVNPGYLVAQFDERMWLHLRVTLSNWQAKIKAFPTYVQNTCGNRLFECVLLYFVLLSSFILVRVCVMEMNSFVALSFMVVHNNPMFEMHHCRFWRCWRAKARPYLAHSI